MTTYYLEANGMEFDVEANSIEEAQQKVRKYFAEQQKPAEQAPMSAMDQASAAAGQFAEGAFGIGDELGAVGKGIGGTLYDLLNTDKSISQAFSDNWSMEKFNSDIDATRANMDRLDAENAALSDVAYGGGLVASLFAPTALGMKAVQAAGAGSKLQKAGVLAGVGAAEGGLYGYLSGRDEGRLDSAGLGAAVGGALGGTLGSWLSSKNKTTRELFDRSTGDVKKTFSPSNAQVERGPLAIGEGVHRNTTMEKLKATIDSLTVRTKDWAAENVDVVSGKRIVDADGEIMRDITRSIQQIDEAAGNTGGLTELHKWFEDTPLGQQMKKELADIGQTDARNAHLTTAERRDRYEGALRLLRNAPESVRKTFHSMNEELRRVVDLDPGQKGTGDYFPFHKLSDAGDAPVTGNYGSPVEGFVGYLEDVLTASKLGKQFGVSPRDTKGVHSAQDLRKLANELTAKGKSDAEIADILRKKMNYNSNTERVIAAIVENQSHLSDVQKANLAEILNTSFVRSRKSGNEFLRGMRTVSNTSQLATLSNIILNGSEAGISATNFGALNTLKALPKSVWSALATDGDRIIDDFSGKHIRSPDLGIVGQHMGEVSGTSAGKRKNFVDTVSKRMFEITGVRKWNRLWQETQINAAKNQAAAAAKSGNLRKLKAAQGMDAKEYQSVVQNLKDGNYKHPDVLNFVFRQITDVAPVSTTSMPKAFNDHPDGKVMYSMLSFMAQQYNLLRNNVWQKTALAYRHGLDTKQGRAALKEAATYGLKYATLTAGLSGLFDDGRKQLRGEDVEWDPVESTMNQLIQLQSFGQIQPRAEQWGKNPVVGLNAAPLSMASDIASSAYDIAASPFNEEDIDWDKVIKRLRRWTPIASTANDYYRYMTGEQMFTED